MEQVEEVSYCHELVKSSFYSDNPMTRFSEAEAKLKEMIENALKEKDDEIATLRRQLKLAINNWEMWKTAAFEMNVRLLKYVPGSPMILNKGES
jgi:hypothetical protein